nr:DUF1684 domain-containing protein [uncultured Actinoplanes sp.]
MTVAASVEEHAVWRAARRLAVTAPTGNLALVRTIWGAGDPDAELAGQAPSVTATRLSRRDALTGIEQHGVRLWDPFSPAIRHFEQIDTFPYHPEWVIEARYTEVPAGRRVPFRHVKDHGRTRDLPVPGDLHLTVAGREHTMSAFDDDGQLLLVFGDPTNGTTTYGGGRFLIVERAPGADRVVLDFNRAYVPPCGFSPHYNCPMPPSQNVFAVPVEAGEKLPVFRDGFTV